MKPRLARRLEWAEDNGVEYIFGLAGNTTLDPLVAETADNLRFHHAILRQAQEQPDQAAHLCELHLPDRQLDTAGQGGWLASNARCSRMPFSRPAGIRAYSGGRRRAEACFNGQLQRQMHAPCTGTTKRLEAKRGLIHSQPALCVSNRLRSTSDGSMVGCRPWSTVVASSACSGPTYDYLRSAFQSPNAPHASKCHGRKWA